MDLLHRVKTFSTVLRGNHYTWSAINISLLDDRRFHLINSIHMGSRDMVPLPAKLFKEPNHADALIVGMNVSGDDAPFANLLTFTALEERTSPEQLENLCKVINELGISPSLLSTRPLWQITMVLQVTQAQQLGLWAKYGIDYQLLKVAKQAYKPVIELEGASSQIELLCQLPDNGLALSDDILTHWHINARLLQQTMGWWLKTPPRNSELTLPSTFSQSLYDVLMHQRNTARRDRLRAMLAGHYVVAAGALHLYGEGNLPEMLR